MGTRSVEAIQSETNLKLVHPCVHGSAKSLLTEFGKHHRLENYGQQEAMENFVFPDENKTFEEFDENE